MLRGIEMKNQELMELLTFPQFHKKVRLPPAVHNILLETSQVP